jgi:hypothetical protein
VHCRRLARKKREAELVAFSATRPDDSFESPADLQAIREAEHNMGDFKLKSDPEYVPPEVHIAFCYANSLAASFTSTVLSGCAVHTTAGHMLLNAACHGLLCELSCCMHGLNLTADSFKQDNLLYSNASCVDC